MTGGGNSAGQAAKFFGGSAAHVHRPARGDSLAASMSSHLIARLTQGPAITIAYGAEVAPLDGTDQLESVTIRSRAEGQDWRLNARAVFVMVGAAPNTGWLQGQVAPDRNGFILTGAAAGAAGPHATSALGIFAVGDVRAGSVKRVASAVGKGSVVVSDVRAHLRRA